MTTDTETVARELKRVARNVLKKDESILFNRIVALTRAGAQDCTYTNEQPQKDLGFNGVKTTRLFKNLENKGFQFRQEHSYGLNLRPYDSFIAP